MTKANSNTNDDAIHQLFIEIGIYLYNRNDLIELDDKFLDVLKKVAVIPIKTNFEVQRKERLRALNIDLQQLKHKTSFSFDLKNQYENLFNNMVETYLWVVEFKK